MAGVAAEARPSLVLALEVAQGGSWGGQLGPECVCFDWFCILGILVLSVGPSAIGGLGSLKVY